MREGRTFPVGVFLWARDHGLWAHRLVTVMWTFTTLVVALSASGGLVTILGHPIDSDEPTSAVVGTAGLAAFAIVVWCSATLYGLAENTIDLERRLRLREDAAIARPELRSDER